MKGHIYKRNCKCDKKKCTCGATWSYMVDIGRDPTTGKRKQKSKGGFKRKKDAELACAELINDIEKGTFTEKTKTTLREFTDKFIDSQIRPNFAPATTYNYEKTLENHLGPYFERTEIQRITPLHVQDFYSYLMKEKGLGAGSVKVIHGCFRRIMQTALEWGVIKNNPVSVVKPPKIEKGSDKVWNLATCLKFLEIAKEKSNHYEVYLLTIFTGLRRGEVLGLSLDNVNFDNNTITIKQQLIVSGKDGKPVLTQTLKSDSSYRTIDVPHDIMQELKEYKKKMKKTLFSKGSINKHNLLFPTIYGNPTHPNGINKDFTLLAKSYGFTHIPFHGLRHSHATILAEMKENVHAISQRLGHASTTITNEVYVHLTEKMRQDLSVNLNNLYETKKNSLTNG